MTNSINWQAKYWLPGIAIAGVAILLLFGAFKPAPEKNEAVSVSPLVDVYRANYQTIDPVIIGFGRAQPQESWAAISEVQGRVIYRHPELKRGRSIAKGTVVLKIDPVDYELAVAQSRSNLKSAELQLQRVTLNKNAYEQSRLIEQGRLKIAKDELKRKEDLKQKGLISNSELEAQRSAVLAQSHALWDLESKLALIPTDNEVALANVKVAQAKLKEAERSLSRTQITLPFDARIGKVNADLDKVVTPQQVLLEAYDVKFMEVTANMSLSDMRSLISATSDIAILPGQVFPDIRNLNLTGDISLTIDEQSFHWRGHVSRLNDSIDVAANSIGLTVEIDQPHKITDPRQKPPLIKDMYVQVDVSGPGKSQLVIPTKALHGNFVYIADAENKLHIREVRLLFNYGELSAVAGVEEGDRIIVTDVLAPQAGMLVRVAQSLGAQP